MTEAGIVVQLTEVAGNVGRQVLVELDRHRPDTVVTAGSSSDAEVAAKAIAASTIAGASVGNSARMSGVVAPSASAGQHGAKGDPRSAKYWLAAYDAGLADDSTPEVHGPCCRASFPGPPRSG